MARLVVQVPGRPVKCGEDLSGCVLLYNVDARFVKGVTVRLIGYQVLEPMSRNMFLEIKQKFSAAEVEQKLRANEQLQFSLPVPEKMLPASTRITPKMLAKYVLEAVVEREGALRRRLKSTQTITMLGLCRPPDAVRTFKTLRQNIGFTDELTWHTALSVDVSFPFGNWLTPGNTCDVGLHLRSDSPLPENLRIERIRVILISKTTFLTDVGDHDSFNRDYTLRKWRQGLDISGKKSVDLSMATRQMDVPSTVFPSFQTLVMECHHIMSVSVLVRYGRHRKYILSRSEVPIVNDASLPQYEQSAQAVQPSLDQLSEGAGEPGAADPPMRPPSQPGIIDPSLQRAPSPPEYVR